MEKFDVPYDDYTLPTLKMNPDGESKGVIVTHGGFDSSYEEFFPQMMYLRQQGYTVYLFEGPSLTEPSSVRDGQENLPPRRTPFTGYDALLAYP